MKIIRGMQPDLVAASVVTLGMFDGVHRGHQRLLTTCRAHADRLGLPAVALTYEPHPSQILHPESIVSLLTPLAEKLALIEQYGIDLTVVPEFTLAFSQLRAESFLRDVLVTGMHPRLVVAGYRTTFGHAREGTAEVLRRAGDTLGFAVEIVAPIAVDGAPVSSSRIRALLAEGAIADANTLLGRPYRLTGTVEHGDARGRTLGFPTANLRVPPLKLLPADGVYVVNALGDGIAHRGVMNLGTRPTFDRPATIEIHLLDFAGDLYGQALAIDIIARLRDIRPFSDVNALTQQIRRDVADARALA